MSEAENGTISDEQIAANRRLIEENYEALNAVITAISSSTASRCRRAYGLDEFWCFNELKSHLNSTLMDYVVRSFDPSKQNDDQTEAQGLIGFASGILKFRTIDQVKKLRDQAVEWLPEDELNAADESLFSTPSSGLEQEEFHDALRGCVTKLKEELQIIFWFWFEGRSNQEIAAMQKLTDLRGKPFKNPDQDINYRLTQIKEKLRACLELSDIRADFLSRS